jgi:hypothetical protein
MEAGINNMDSDMSVQFVSGAMLAPSGHHSERLSHC